MNCKYYTHQTAKPASVLNPTVKRIYWRWFLYFPLITAEPLVKQVKKTRLKREDFHILKVIGRGNFSEVSMFGAGSTDPNYNRTALEPKD